MRDLTYAIMLHHVVAEKRVIPGRIRDDRPKSERCRELPPYGGRSRLSNFRRAAGDTANTAARTTSTGLYVGIDAPTQVSESPPAE